MYRGNFIVLPKFSSFPVQSIETRASRGNAISMSSFHEANKYVK